MTTPSVRRRQPPAQWMLLCVMAFQGDERLLAMVGELTHLGVKQQKLETRPGFGPTAALLLAETHYELLCRTWFCADRCAAGRCNTRLQQATQHDETCHCRTSDTTQSIPKDSAHTGELGTMHRPMRS